MVPPTRAAVATPTQPGALLHPLTTVRFLAALTVVMFHFGGDALGHLPRAIQLIFERGYVSVSFFFVLSGFILTYTYLKGSRPVGAAEFYQARFARIYPVYLLAFLLQGIFELHDWMTRGTTTGIVPLLAGGLIALALLQSWVVTWIPEWNPPGWSLSTEAFFYLCFPAAGKWIAKLSPIQTRIGCAVLCGLLAMPVFVDLTPFQGQPTAHQLDLVGCSPIVRSLEFFLGMLAGKLYLEGPAKRGNLMVALSTAGILAVLWGSSTRDLTVLGRQALIPLFALLILGLGSSKGRLQRWLSLPFPVLLGQASYALYILHWPVYRIALAVRAGLLDRSPDDHNPGTLFFLVYLAGVVAISILVFKVVELPAREYLRHLRFHRRASVIANQAASSSPVPSAASCTGAVPCPGASAEVS